eukprot:1530067-Rhodomonas_salina.1
MEQSTRVMIEAVSKVEGMNFKFVVRVSSSSYGVQHHRGEDGCDYRPDHEPQHLEGPNDLDVTRSQELENLLMRARSVSNSNRLGT